MTTFLTKLQKLGKNKMGLMVNQITKITKLQQLDKMSYAEGWATAAYSCTNSRRAYTCKINDAMNLHTINDGIYLENH